MKTDKQYYSALARSPIMLKKLLLGIAEAEFLGKGKEEAVKRFASALARTMALADVLGRKKVVDTVNGKIKSKFHAIDEDYDSLIVARFGAYETLSSPSEDQFEEAFDALMERVPIVARYKHQIQEAYGLGKFFAVWKLPLKLSLKAAEEITGRLWEKVTELGMEGRSPDKAKKVLAEIGNFSEAYAETIYRTNLASAYTAGRFRQMEDPDVKAVAPAFEYNAVMDASTRKNHAAADGLIASTDDKVWDTHAPPAGFNCRCDLRIITVFELEERGLLKNGKVKTWYPATFKNAHPDKGFTPTKPDRRMYT